MKYPRELANSEIISKKYIKSKNLIKNFIDEKSIDINTLERNAFSIRGYGTEPVLDSVARFFEKHYKDTIKYPDGKECDAIGRKNDPSESHYQIVMKMKTFHDYAYGGYKEVIRQEKTNLSKLAKYGLGKKLFLFKDGSSYYTDPLRISFLNKIDAYEKGMMPFQAGQIASEARRYSNMTGGYIKGKNEYIIIEIFKPLFNCMLELNQHGGIGRNFIQIPPSIYAELLMMKKELKDDDEFRVYDKYGNDPEIAAKEARLTYLFAAKTDNKKSDNYIHINGLNFALACFPSFVRQTHDNKLVLRHEKGFDMESKLKKAIILLKKLGEKGKMNEGQFIPKGLDENTKQHRKDKNVFSIKIERPNNKTEISSPKNSYKHK
jgi:hypothetical protein